MITLLFSVIQMYEGFCAVYFAVMAFFTTFAHKAPLFQKYPSPPALLASPLGGEDRYTLNPQQDTLLGRV